MPTYTMCTKVTFPANNGRREIVIRKITEIHIESSKELLTDVAEILLPRNIKFSQDGVTLNKLDLKKIFRRSDPVIIELGYDGDEFMHVEFDGYITDVSADVPFVIKCQDEMWKLKQIPVNYQATNVTLDKLLRDIIPGYVIDVDPGIVIGNVRFPNTTVAQVLDKLKNEPWGLKSFMKGKVLVCGKYYSAYSSLPPVHFHLEKNIANNDLSYRSPEQPIKIKGKSILSNGNKLEYEIGDNGGDIFTLTYCGIEDINVLKAKVIADYETAKQGGLTGSITAFGTPRVVHGMKATLTSDLYPDRNGTYYIESVNKDFEVPRYRQTIKLGARVA